METHADAKYTIVGAASILAKVCRDRAVLTLRKRVGDFGWGYPSEKAAIDFLKSWYATYESWPDFVRSRWGTCHRLQCGPSNLGPKP